VRKQLAGPLVVFLAAGAVAAPAAGAETVTSVGNAIVTVVPGNPENNTSIKTAVDKAQAAGVPLAMTEAREHGAKLAELSGLTLGDIESVSDSVAGFYGPYGQYSPFGPDQYCGLTSRRIHVRGSDGKLRTKRVRVRRCFFPRRLQVTLQVTFRATKKA
jgi:hypothetical protein